MQEQRGIWRTPRATDLLASNRLRLPQCVGLCIPGGWHRLAGGLWLEQQRTGGAHLPGHLLQPGDLLPVKILVQFERATGRYGVTFEDTGEERWKTRPGNFGKMRE